MDKYLDRIVKAPPAVKFGGLLMVVVLMTAANYFFVVQPMEEEMLEAIAQIPNIPVPRSSDGNVSGPRIHFGHYVPIMALWSKC